MVAPVIYAVATAPGRAGIAVLRISGVGSRRGVEALTGPLPAHGRTVRNIVSETDGFLDEALVLTFDQGKSFTGEETVELHLHGSPATVRAVLASLAKIPGFRPAEPGQFTRRALENGKLNLLQVEGLSDLLEADTEAQRKLALRSFGGESTKIFERWRADLLRALALIEASIDFSDEEDVPADVVRDVGGMLDRVRSEFHVQLAGIEAAEIVRDGFEVAIVGAPNTGKSTLLNRLAGRDAAITSSVAGTTRDVIEVRLDVGGFAVLLLDTAGIRETSDEVEAIGVARARERASEADLRIYLKSDPDEKVEQEEPSDIVLLGRADLHGVSNEADGISGITGLGVSSLIARISDILEQRTQGDGLASRERHRVAIRSALNNLERAGALFHEIDETPDLVAESIRLAIVDIEALVGRIDVEHVLGEIFANFCIGK